MKRLRSEGKNNVEIAKILGVSRQWVIRHSRREGLGQSTATGGASETVIKLTPAKLARLAEMREQGYSNAAIAEELQIGISTILWAVRKHGLPARKPGKQPKRDAT